MSINSVPSHPEGQEQGVRFGRTLLTASATALLDHRTEAIVCPANRRGVMGVGIAGMVRHAGGVEIEREAMALAPMAIGSAVSTSSGTLESRGVKIVIHAVVSDALGAPTRQDIVRRATTAVLEQADRHRIKSLSIPPLGSGLGPGRLPTGVVGVLMIEEIVAHLRRFTSRIERIVLVQSDSKEVVDMLAVIEQARGLFWGLRV